METKNKLFVLDIKNLTESEQIFNLKEENKNLFVTKYGDTDKEFVMFQLQSATDSIHDAISWMQLNGESFFYTSYLSAMQTTSSLIDVPLNFKLGDLILHIPSKGKLTIVFIPYGADIEQLTQFYKSIPIDPIYKTSMGGDIDIHVYETKYKDEGITILGEVIIKKDIEVFGYQFYKDWIISNVGDYLRMFSGNDRNGECVTLLLCCPYNLKTSSEFMEELSRLNN